MFEKVSAGILRERNLLKRFVETSWVREQRLVNHAGRPGQEPPEKDEQGGRDHADCQRMPSPLKFHIISDEGSQARSSSRNRELRSRTKVSSSVSPASQRRAGTMKRVRPTAKP